LRENKTWVFSGIGIAVPIALIGWLVSCQGGNINELKVRLGVTEEALHTFFDILEQENVPAEQWLVCLGKIAERHKQALKRLAALETEDPQARALASQARGAIEANDYGRAESLLDRAKQRELAGIRGAKKLRREAQTTVERRRISAAALEAEQAEVLLIQLRYRQAAERFAAAELIPASKPEQRLDYRERRADALYRQGNEQGDNAALRQSIRAYRDLLGEYPRDRVPLDWARVQTSSMSVNYRCKFIIDKSMIFYKYQTTISININFTPY